MPVRERHLARLDSLRQAAEAVAGLARGTEVEALRIAWLLVSLESAYTWVPDAPEPPASVDRTDSEMKDEAFRLDLAMIAAREAVAERLAYHLLNEAQPEESEMCEEFECPEECSGRHDSTHIDCGPDAVFEDLADHDITVEQPEPEPLAPRLAALLGRTEAEERHSPLPDLEEQAPLVLAHFGMPGWPGAVASAMERLALLDRSGAPGVLADLAAVEASLLDAPDRLGADALDWISHQALLGWRAS
ncbi:hypothetical protein OG365_26005 [Streptomyces sp. NBC_00853]|uniref:hypothetical protein n=1 Tax=Streptomyces sp. NBC_00853 TaxID=2903681 RepID=UPI003872BC41|nr:hypothetical protein OG365_26005 [Streptomyces sp. NBC_00853]